MKDINTDTLNAKYDQLEQLISMARGSGFDNTRLSAYRLVIETQNTSLEITAEDDSLELREIEE